MWNWFGIKEGRCARENLEIKKWQFNNLRRTGQVQLYFQYNIINIIYDIMLNYRLVVYTYKSCFRTPLSGNVTHAR